MLGLVLEGGGAKGAFHAGAVKALIERGYAFDGVAGASIGALNGAMIAQGDFDKCYKLWENISPSTFLDVEDEKFNQLFDGDFEKNDLSYAIKLAKNAILNKGLSMEKVESIVNNYIFEDKLKLTKTDYCLITVNVSDNWRPLEIFKEEIPTGFVNKYILASAYYPAFNRPKIQGNAFMDGGMYDNCPINPLIRRGYNEIIAIRTMSKMPNQRVIDKSVKINYILPSVKLGKTLDMRNTKVKYNLNLGYFDALRFTDNLLGTIFYIKPFNDSYLLNYLESLDIDFFSKISLLFNINGNKSSLINKFISEAKKALKIYSSFNLTDNFISILEKIIDLNKMEKFKIYDIIDFIKLLEFDNNNIEKLYKSSERVLRVIELLKQYSA